MADPASLATIGAIASMAGTAFSAMNQIQQGKDQKKWYEYNAAVAERDAEEARKIAEYEAEQTRKEGQKLLSAQQARYASSGVTFEGSPLLLMEETAKEIELDALMTERTGEVTAQKYTTEAALSRMKGSSANTAGYYGAGSTLLTGAGQAASSYSKYKTLKVQ